MKNLPKSAGAILAGFASVAVLSTLTDSLLESVGIFPPITDPEATVAWMLIVALVYRSVYTIAGGYITARLAPQKPMQHVAVLMILGGLGGLAGVIAGWSFGHHWYPILLALTGPLCLWVGGKIVVRSRK